MDAWNNGDEILRLARQSPLWGKSKTLSDAILNLSEPMPPEVLPTETKVPKEKEIPF